MDPDKNLIYQPLANDKDSNLIGETMGRVFETGLRVNRPSKILFKGDETKQLLRSAVSGSVKQKLNLQNTKLKINIDNLSSMISIHQTNESHFKIQINKYKQKINKYKLKIKEKDQIIAKLLQKIERRIQLDSGKIQSVLIKLHQQNLKGFQYKIGRGQNISVDEILIKYQQLIKSFSQQEKQRLYLQGQKNDLQKTVKQLRETIKYFGQNKNEKQNTLQAQKIRNQLLQTEKVMKKQKMAIEKLLSTIKQSNIQIAPQISQVLRQIQTDRRSLGKSDYASSQPYRNTQQLFNLRQKLALSQTNLYRQRQQRQGTQKDNNLLKQKLSLISQKIVMSNNDMERVKKSIDQIQARYAKQIRQLQNKIQILLNDSNDLQQYKNQVQEISNKFNDALGKFDVQSKKWSQLQTQYQQKIDQFRQKRRFLEDRLDKQTQKRRIFELKLMDYDQQNGARNIDINQQNNEQKQLYLDQRVQILRKQSLRNKKQNQNLNTELKREKRAFQILQRQLKDAEQRVFQLEQVLKRQNINLNTVGIKTNLSVDKSIQYNQAVRQSNEDLKQKIIQQTAGLKKQDLQQKVVQLNYHINYLQNQMKQLRNKNIENQISFQNAKKQFQIKQSHNLQTIDKIRKSSVNNSAAKRGRQKSEDDINVEPGQKQGGYNIKIRQVSDIPSEIQNLSFQQLASKYQASRQQILFLKQKIEQILKLNAYQNVNGQQPKTPKNNNQDMILTDQYQQNSVQNSNSQQIDEDTYRNINQEMDRLMNKNKNLEKEIQNMRNELQSKISVEHVMTLQLKDKLRSAEEVNANLSNIVVHLEGELSRYQNLENSGSFQQQRGGSQIYDGVSAKKSDKYEIKKKIQQKKKQFEDMLRSQSSIHEDKLPDYQQKLKNLQLQIRQLQQQSKHSSGQKYKTSQRQSQSQRPQQCQNCQSLSKINVQLIRKIAKSQQSRQQQLATTRQQLQSLQSEHPSSQPDLLKQNHTLKQIISQLKTNLTYTTKQHQDYQSELNNLREVNEQLLLSIHEKEKQLLKLRTEMYRQDYEREGVDQSSIRKIDQIMGEYERKIEELQGIVKGNQKSEVNLSDLYDTINYLNGQCQTLKKANQLLRQSSTVKQSQSPQILPTYPPQVPQQPQVLKQNYLKLISQLQSLDQTLQQNNYSSLSQLLESTKQQKQKNLQLMKQNNKLQNKIQNINTKNEEYFKKIGQGQVYEIIQDKDKEIDVMKEQNQGFKAELQNLANQRHKMFIQNQKISQDLKNIQENIQKLTGNKFSFQSTGVDRSSLIKNLQNTGLQSITMPSSSGYPIPAPTPLSISISPQQSQFILDTISKKLQKLKNSIQNSSHKVRPYYQLYSFQQLQTLDDVIVILTDRLHFVWNLVEQRTSQYNELRDQMNIISMQCMKNSKYEIEGSGESQSKIRTVDVLEERYEEVLAELIQYENQNKRLEREVNRLKTQLSMYKKQVQQMQSKYVTFSQLRSQSSEEVPYNKQILNKVLQSGNIVTNTSQIQIPQIIKLFLARIKQLQGNLETIQIQFDEKNRKLESLIQKEKSFISQKSRLNRESDEESAQVNKRDLVASGEIRREDRNLSSGVVNATNINVIDQKSYSVNSIKLFKQIEQLTKNNDQLKQKKSKYKATLDSTTKMLQTILQSAQSKNLQAAVKQELQKIINNISGQLQLEQSKKDNSGFDLEGADVIVAGGFVEKGGKKGEIEDIKSTFENKADLERNRKKQVDFNRRIQSNNKFLDENKFLLDQLVNKLSALSGKQFNTQNIKAKLSEKLNDKQLLQLFYKLPIDQAATKILQLIAETEKKVVVQKQKSSTNKKTEQPHQTKYQQIIQQGEWVQTEQLETIINQVYPVKSDLCIIVANSINMLMLAETKQGILKAVEFLFTNLKNKEIQLKQQVRKRDEAVTQYGKKLQKLLTYKYSEDESQSHEKSSSLLNQNSFRKTTTQIRSQFQIKKQQEANMSKSQSNSHNYSSMDK